MALVQGQILEVSITPAGDETTIDHDEGETTLQLGDVSDFAEDGGQLQIGETIYDYTGIDADALTVQLAAPGLVEDAPEETPVYVYPLADEKWAMVETNEGDEEPVLARVPHYLYDLLIDGVRNEMDQESVLVGVNDGDWTVTDLVGTIPRMDGSHIDPGTLPEPSPSDGNPPPAVGTVEAIGGIGTIHLRWVGVTNADPVRYRVYGSRTSPVAQDATTLIGDTGSTGVTVRKLEEEEEEEATGLSPGVDYHFVVVSYDADGDGDPSPEATAQTVLITGPDIAASTITGDNIVGNTITGDKFSSMIANSSLFTTGALDPDTGEPTGARIDMGPVGWLIVGPDGAELMKFPLDGSAASIQVHLDALSALIRGLRLVGGDNSLEPGSTLTARKIAPPPSAAPVLSSSVPLSPTLDLGIVTPSGGVASDGTVLWVGVDATFQVFDLTTDAYATARGLPYAPATAWYDAVTGRVYYLRGGVYTRLYWFDPADDSTGSVVTGSGFSSFCEQVGGNVQLVSPRTGNTARVGLVGAYSSSGRRVAYCEADKAAPDALAVFTETPSGVNAYAPGASLQGATYTSGDFGAPRLVLTWSTNAVTVIDPATNPMIVKGADGSYEYWAMDQSQVQPLWDAPRSRWLFLGTDAKFREPTSWTLPDLGLALYVAMTRYRTDGSYETIAGPMVSINQLRRRVIRVQVPPTGDDETNNTGDRWGVYAAVSDSEPFPSDLHLIDRIGERIAFDSLEIDASPTSGDAPPGTGTFPGGFSAWLRSEQTIPSPDSPPVWWLRGNGAGRVGAIEWDGDGETYIPGTEDTGWVSDWASKGGSTPFPNNSNTTIGIAKYRRVGRMVQVQIQVTAGAAFNPGSADFANQAVVSGLPSDVRPASQVQMTANFDAQPVGLSLSSAGNITMVGGPRNSPGWVQGDVLNADACYFVE